MEVPIGEEREKVKKKQPKTWRNIQMFKEQGPPKGPPAKLFKLKHCGAEQDDEECPVDTLEQYLYFIQEKEWDDKDVEWDNDEVEVIRHFISTLDRKDTDRIDANRHSFQPSMYSIYLKNVAGDYRGRIDTLNSRRVPSLGVEKIKKDLPRLIRRKQKARSMSIVPKKTLNALKNLMYRDNYKNLEKGAPTQ